MKIARENSSNSIVEDVAPHGYEPPEFLNGILTNCMSARLLSSSREGRFEDGV
jgi:hypothetical protein